DLDSALTHLARNAELRHANGDSAGALYFRALGQALRGYRLARVGQTRQAIAALKQAQTQLQGEPNQMVRWWIAQLFLQSGRPREARPYFASFWHTGMRIDIPASLYLGRIDEALGRRETALAEYARFARAWRDADSAVQPMVREANAAVQRLMGGRARG
ncbi:MAG TPA: hypothetical protein VK864_08025, partial [Longimicrobiales bacterium]|nr:hypothetical protein [Longimicrobiales bacterium]